MNTLLPIIKDRNHFAEIFKDNHLWEPAISHLVKKYNLDGESKRGTLGSHIVYRVGNHWIKLMAPLFGKDMVYEISGLNAVENKLSVQTPKIIAQGELEAWPYVVITHIEGESIRHVWPQFSIAEKTLLSEQIAKTVIEISLCPADSVIESRFEWTAFITKQYQEWEIHQKRKGLEEAWLSAVGPFLNSFSIDEFLCSKPVFLHADLTFDHFLITQSGQPKVSGVIDMADCQVGHFEYELVAPCVFIFKGQKELLHKFLIGCGFNKTQLNDRFSEKLLAWSILHRYFSMISYFKDELESTKPGDFVALAKKVFPL